MQPRLTTLRALQLQEAEYYPESIFIPCDGRGYPLERTIMNDVNRRTIGDFDERENLMLETTCFFRPSERNVTADGEDVRLC